MYTVFASKFAFLCAFVFPYPFLKFLNEPWFCDQVLPPCPPSDVIFKNRWPSNKLPDQIDFQGYKDFVMARYIKHLFSLKFKIRSKLLTSLVSQYVWFDFV